MQQMTKKERVVAALNKQDVDRIPLSMWYHLPEVDQDPVSLAETSVALNRQYGYDFIKMMPFGNYGAQDYGLSVRFFCTKTQSAKEIQWGIRSVDDWLNIEPLPAYYGSYGKQVQFAHHIGRALGEEDTPYIQTLFTPMSTAMKLAGPRLFEDMRSHSRSVHQALEAITQTTISFVKANIEAGVAGFFLASKCAGIDLMTEAEYDAFCTPYDTRVVEAYKDLTYFNVAHIHGPDTRFKKMASLPVNCVNWHDRWVAPSMSEARIITDKCLMGGIHEKKFVDMQPEEIRPHLEEAVAGAGRRGLILSPGCCAKMDTPQINFYSVRLAAENL